jgi:hypothetical protein
MLGKQPLHPPAQLRVRLTSLVEERRPLGRTAPFENFYENVAFAHDWCLA